MIRWLQAHEQKVIYATGVCSLSGPVLRFPRQSKTVCSNSTPRKCFTEGALCVPCIQYQ
jgi:hypothetical protein